MYLEKAVIVNFRGIRKLSVDFQEDSTVLIGENHWGKTSLLRVLWMVLGQGEQLCKFSKEDLYVPIEINNDNQVISFDESDTQRPPIDFSEKSYSANLDNNISLKKHPFSRFINPLLQRRRLRLEEKKKNSKKNDKTFFEDLNQYIDKHLPEIEKADQYESTDRHIRVDLYFKESLVADKSIYEESLKPYWYFDKDGQYSLHYQIVAFQDESTDKFVTRHSLLNQNNQTHKFDDNTKKAIQTIIKFNPVFRLRDSRMEASNTSAAFYSKQPKLKELLEKLSEDNELSAEYMNSVVNGLVSNFGSFVEKYLTCYSSQDENKEEKNQKRNLDDIVRRPVSLESLANIKRMLKAPGVNKSKALASYISINMLISNKDRDIDPNSQPIIILEDIESRFHPSLLLSLWSILEQTQSQKIVTTNSGDLLSSIPLDSLRRLDRRVYDTICYKIEKHSLSYEDLRRIAFHIRLNRPMALFARTWLLVEGETEVWLLTQIANILGVSLPCEGIRIIEFAQCGLKPLIKLALELGINFHVLADGDEAGNKYADTTRAFLGKKKTTKYLTVLPHKDIEHYLYANGYEKTFKTASGLVSGKFFQKKSSSMDKIIEAAIRKKSKPGLALLLVDAIQKKGIQGIPKELVDMIETVRLL